MYTAVNELSDNRYIGYNIFEIDSFPNIEMNSDNNNNSLKENTHKFDQIIKEFHKLTFNRSVVAEFLWITEKTNNQIFKSRIHIYCILRQIGADRSVVCYELQHLQDNFILSLSTSGFNLKKVNVNDNQYKDLLGTISKSCTYAVIKTERCNSNINSFYPYYFCDIVPQDNSENFGSIISALSQRENCCISFQIISTQFTDQERFLINELSAELNRIVDGITLSHQFYRDSSAIEPSKVMSYYLSKLNSPVFQYNIIVFGDRPSCATIATKIISLLQNGKTKIINSNFGCIDISNEKIDLSNQFITYPWNINNKLLYNYRNQALLQSVPVAAKLFRLPYLMTAEEVSSFFRLPLYEKSMSAIKSSQLIKAMEQFESSVVDENNVKFGKVISSDNLNLVIGCSEKSFTKHALVVGTPGSGKTTFSVSLLLQFAKRKVPFLAIEPTKTEYRAMIDAIPDLQVFTPGNSMVSPFVINPFIPPKGIKIEQYIPSLVSAFNASFSMPQPLDFIFLKAIRTCYIKYGWKEYSKYGDSDVTVFGLYEFILTFKQLINDTNYSAEIKGNIQSAGLLRLTNLIEQNSNIYDTINTVPIEDLLSKPTVLELNSIDNSEQKSLIMALLLINICLYTKNNNINDGELKNIILIDEAHVLLGGSTPTNGEGADSQATTIKALQDMIAEIRSYGTGMIIADQSPTKVSREVVANTDIKVSFRLVQSIEKQLIADSTNMDSYAQQQISKLKPGEAFIYYSKLEAPQMILTEDIREKEGIRLNVSNDEVAARTTYWNTRKALLKPYNECKLCKSCKCGCDFRIRSDANFFANKLFANRKTFTNEFLKKYLANMSTIIDQFNHSYSTCEKIRVVNCTNIKLLRKVQLETSVSLSNSEINQFIRDN